MRKTRAHQSARKKRPAAAKWSPQQPGKSPAAVFLVGFMGAGKTSVGRALGLRLNWAFEDLDDRIERREGRTVAEIFRQGGETDFRRAERSALKAVLDELKGGAVRIVALGGGAFVQQENAALLREARIATVFLDAPVAHLWRRCCDQARETGTQRPLLQSQEQFQKLHRSRRAGYTKASHTVETGNRTVEEIATEIEHALSLKRMPLREEQGEVE